MVERAAFAREARRRSRPFRRGFPRARPRRLAPRARAARRSDALPRFERATGGAALERLARLVGRTLGIDVFCDDERGGGIEHERVARGVWLAREHFVE